MQQWSLQDKEVQPDQSDKPVETTVDEKPDDTKTEEVAKETTEVTSAPVENAPVAEEPTEPVPEAPTSEEPTDTSEKETEDQGNAEEETPAIKVCLYIRHFVYPFIVKFTFECTQKFSKQLFFNILTYYIVFKFSLRLHQLIFVSQQQIKQGIALRAILNITGTASVSLFDI